MAATVAGIKRLDLYGILGQTPSPKGRHLWPKNGPNFALYIVLNELPLSHVTKGYSKECVELHGEKLAGDGGCEDLLLGADWSTRGQRYRCY